MHNITYVARFVEERLGNLSGYQSQIPNISIYVDYERNPIGAFINALKIAGDNPCVMFEDDVLLCDNFIQRSNEAILRHPDSVIQFFSMRGKDIEVGSRWDNDFIMAQCVYLPRNYARLITEYFKGTVWDLNQHTINGLDLLIRDFLKSRKEKYWIECPNLVDHRIGKSVIDSRRSSKRISKTFKKQL